MSPDLPQPDPRALIDHRSFVRELSRSLLGAAHDADDLEQDVWALTLAGGATPLFDERADALRWLGRVVRNRARTWRRAAGRRRLHERRAARAEASEAAPSAVERAELAQRVVQLVLRLAPPLREVVLRRYYEGESPRQIAAQLGISRETVKTRLRRALDELRGSAAREIGADVGDWRPALAGLALAPRALPWAAIGALAVVLVAASAWHARERESTRRPGLRFAPELGASWRVTAASSVRLELAQAELAMTGTATVGLDARLALDVEQGFEALDRVTASDGTVELERAIVHGRASTRAVGAGPFGAIDATWSGKRAQEGAGPHRLRAEPGAAPLGVDARDLLNVDEPLHVGARWAAPAAALAPLLTALMPPVIELEQDAAVRFHAAQHWTLGEWFHDTLSGEVELHWSEELVRDGRALARIPFELTAHDEVDVIAFRCAARGIEPQSAAGTLDARITLDGHGELVWNLDLGRLESWSIAGRVELELASRRRIARGGEDVELEQGSLLAGTLAGSITVVPQE